MTQLIPSYVPSDTMHSVRNILIISVLLLLLTLSNKGNTETDTHPLWERLRAQFSMSQSTEYSARIKYHVQRYKRHPEQLEAMAKRAMPYLQHIVAEVEKRGLPGELALLPMIESAFNPVARSPKGAGGLWQIMPRTGRHLGITVNGGYDGRFALVDSTDAALNYLEYLNARFKGNWSHSLAAYNAGEGRIEQAIRKNYRAGKKTGFADLALPKETKDYVPKLLALAEIVAHPEKYNIVLPDTQSTPKTMTVAIKHPMSFVRIAELAQMSVQEIKKLNPAYRTLSALPAKGVHSLLMPMNNAKLFLKQMARIKL